MKRTHSSQALAGNLYGHACTDRAVDIMLNSVDRGFDQAQNVAIASSFEIETVATR